MGPHCITFMNGYLALKNLKGYLIRGNKSQADNDLRSSSGNETKARHPHNGPQTFLTDAFTRNKKNKNSRAVLFPLQRKSRLVPQHKSSSDKLCCVQRL